MNAEKFKLQKMYKLRFPEEELEKKRKLWEVLIDSVLQKYIKDTDTVVDIGGGECLFINNIRCGRKYVVDLNPQTKEYANRDVTVINENASSISSIEDKSINAVFVSNFFEHLRDWDELEKVIGEIKRILKPKGLLIVIQPNIRYAYKEYWDFPDHHIPISHNSLSELLMLNGFQIKECWPRFLPWRPKGRLSGLSFLFKLYLKVPIFWRLFGKQALIVAELVGRL
jgi:ubiquinone/menaquinone biosynthesis C-methylase UbiE